MTRKVLTSTLGWKSVGLAGVLLVTIPAGSPAARQRAVAGATEVLAAPLVDASESSGFRSGSWLRARRHGADPGLEVQLDDLLREITAGGGLRLDRAALGAAGQAVVGEGVALENMAVGELLDRVGSIRVTSQGVSVVLGPRTVARVLRRVLGTESRIETLTVGEALDGLTGAQVTAAGVRGRLEHRALADALGAILAGAPRPDHSADAAFDRRGALQAQYRDVVSLVRQIRRAGVSGLERNKLYDQAYDRLLKADQAHAVPLLDGHLRLEEEMATSRLGTDGRAQRIASRWEARRRAFGDEMADLLFGRQEAMERYEVDRLAIAADRMLSAAQKAQRLERRRAALKVELAAQGSYVSFPGTALAAPQAEQEAAPDAPAAPLEIAPARGGRRR